MESMASMTVTKIICDINTCKKEIDGAIRKVAILDKHYDLCHTCLDSLKSFISERLTGGTPSVLVPLTSTPTSPLDGFTLVPNTVPIGMIDITPKIWYGTESTTVVDTATKQDTPVNLQVSNDLYKWFLSNY